MVIGIYGGGPAVEVWGTLSVGAALSVFCLKLAEYGSAFPMPADIPTLRLNLVDHNMVVWL
jgi:hypothetical protein